MRVEGSVPITDADLSVETNDAKEAVRQFKQEYPQARVAFINGVAVRGICGCGEPVLDTTVGYVFDKDEEAYLCPNCAFARGKS